ncbi:tail protein X [Methylovirgula sp. 4M-Z18]|uniref:tail protein X n=1 Tax=Methylovirgula sp. 4M-Z18 TaxID=2293567 RepID=UPI000E2F5153|nr:tail protein X [Methylovirgula sp. 4M-Z18]RFB80389.1 phage tail protein [Methylovirgula sp. 4M-Z18]
MTTETLTFLNDETPLDLLLWRRYLREVPGLVEQVLAGNPGLAALGLMPPRGTKIVVTVPAPVTRSGKPTISLYD